MPKNISRACRRSAAILVSATKDPVDIEIVGVARTARYNSLEHEIPPVIYTSYLQAENTGHSHGCSLSYAPPAIRWLSPTPCGIVRQLDLRVPIADMTTQSRRIDETIVQEQTFADLCTGFGVLALVMACVGLYAAMAYAVTRRTSEIGIGVALGAERRRIV